MRVLVKVALLIISISVLFVINTLTLECTPTICTEIKVKCNSAEFEPCHGHIERCGGGLCGCCPTCISNQDPNEGQA
uniref:Uncharacterized protein n=1 Tax=Pristhesancus plagipennis TaxID=1955184 RepID=A0A2K8JX45_PRIPG|nr:secreted hypothetical protein [Pristhesancus plagipennis]